MTGDRHCQLKVADSSLNSVDRGYAYDTAWNLAWRTNAGTAESFSVDSRNQLTSVPGGAVTYDSNGNMLSTDNTGRRYSYDDENQLVTITVKGSVRQSIMLRAGPGFAGQRHPADSHQSLQRSELSTLSPQLRLNIANF